jgi:hypothetical protein
MLTEHIISTDTTERVSFHSSLLLWRGRDVKCVRKSEATDTPVRQKDVKTDNQEEGWVQFVKG